MEPLLAARRVLREKFAKLHRKVHSKKGHSMFLQLESWHVG
jgi:hypothetical protein